jgi:uncharacterized protein (DUF433 family)
MQAAAKHQDWQDRIVRDPRILAGKPTIRGTRLAVEYVVDLLAGGHTPEEIIQSWPYLTMDDIKAALAYAAAAVRLQSAHADEPPAA